MVVPSLPVTCNPRAPRPLTSWRPTRDCAVEKSRVCTSCPQILSFIRIQTDAAMPSFAIECHWPRTLAVSVSHRHRQSEGKLTEIAFQRSTSKTRPAVMPQTRHALHADGRPRRVNRHSDWFKSALGPAECLDEVNRQRVHRRFAHLKSMKQVARRLQPAAVWQAEHHGAGLRFSQIDVYCHRIRHAHAPSELDRNTDIAPNHGLAVATCRRFLALSGRRRQAFALGNWEFWAMNLLLESLGCGRED
jgi:hypothetical protein